MTSSVPPLIAAVEMGYGHMRAAHSLARATGLPVLQVDRPPLADEEDQRLWNSLRRLYEVTSRTSQLPGIGLPLRSLLDALSQGFVANPWFVGDDSSAAAV